MKYVLILLISVSAFADQSECTPEFPLLGKFRGGDAIYSIKLNEKKSLWLFGDTFVAQYESEPTRKGSFFVHNTVAISECREGKFGIKYHWNYAPLKDEQGVIHHWATEVFKPRGKGLYYWPSDGFFHQKSAYVFLHKVKNDPKAPLGFTLEGMDLAKIENPLDNFSKWKITYQPITSRGSKIVPGTGTFKIKGIAKYLYFYAFVQNDPYFGKISDEQKAQIDAANIGTSSHTIYGHPMTLMRIDLSKLDAVNESLELVNKKGSWSKNLDPKNAKIVLKNGASELSLNYDAQKRRYVIIQSAGVYPKNTLYKRESKNIRGPWSDPELIYIIPETLKSHKDYHKNTFCYAGKEHEQFRKAGEYIVTYACNNPDFETIYTNMGIYIPKTIKAER